jgi:hypothetical protein
LVEFHSRDKRSASSNNNMNSKLIFEASMMKPLLRRSKWIYGTLVLELGQRSYDILKVLQVVKTIGSDLRNQRVRFLWIRLEYE